MTADVLSLDKVRISDRVALTLPPVTDIGIIEAALGRSYEWLKRRVGAEADKQFGPGSRDSVVYLTYEEIFEPPKPAPAA